jgi:hypothetical protein
MFLYSLHRHALKHTRMIKVGILGGREVVFFFQLPRQQNGLLAQVGDKQVDRWIADELPA